MASKNEFNKLFGKKMKKLRKERGLTISELAHETGLSPSLLSKIEEGSVSPSVSNIIQISKVLSVDSGSFLSPQEIKDRERKRIESYVKRTSSYSYKVLTPGAEKKHMKAFLVTIDPKQDHKMVEYHHEGEEFIYVLQGKLEIKVGDNTTVLEKGEAIHFNSALTHKLRNLSDEKTELIVVVYTP